MNNKKTRLIVDIGMVVLLPLLMAYSLIGEQFHEIIGTVMLVLFIIHLIQNRKWITAIPKGRYNARRTFQTVLDLLLLVFMILQPLFRKLRSGKTPVKAGSVILTFAIFLYGIYAMIKRQLLSYMFLKTTFAFFDFSESRVLFILDYLAIMILFAVTGLLITMVLSNTNKRKR